VIPASGVESRLENFQTDVTPEPAASEPNKPGVLRVIVDIIETLVLSALLFAAINVISARIRVDGQSMLPTLNTGEFVIVNKLAYKVGLPKYGDIIVFHFPRDPEQEYIKRVIGLAGDRIVIAKKQVQVNGTLLEEPYIAAPPLYEADWTVPENSLFVLGDNRNNSSDSHNWGPVPMDYVVGKALFIYWPLDKWGFLGSYSTSALAAIKKMAAWQMWTAWQESFSVQIWQPSAILSAH
jgi:signal peptidase I